MRTAKRVRATKHSSVPRSNLQSERRLATLDEIPDSFEEERQSSASIGVLLVQIEIHDDFPREDYIIYTNSSQSRADCSFTSVESSLPHTAQSVGYGSGVIPDSQELPDSQSFKPPQSADSDASTLTSSPPTPIEAIFGTSNPSSADSPWLIKNSGDCSWESPRHDLDSYPDTYTVLDYSELSQNGSSCNFSRHSVISGTDPADIPLSQCKLPFQFQTCSAQSSQVDARIEDSDDLYLNLSAENPTKRHIKYPTLSASDLPLRQDTLHSGNMMDEQRFSSAREMPGTGILGAARQKGSAEEQFVPLIPRSSPQHSDTTSHVLPVRENAEAPIPDSTLPLLNENDGALARDAGDVLHLPTRYMEHYVLLPLVSMERDVYRATINDARSEIEAFMGKGNRDATILSSIETMIDQLYKICDHQDLVNDISPSQLAMPDNMKAKWAENCSTKCLFLREMLDALRKSEVHVAILARPGRMLDILEAMFKAHRYIYIRPDQPLHLSLSGVGPMKITLLPTGTEGGRHVINRADAVIAFDSTFYKSERYSKTLRTSLIEPDHLSPLISLVVTHAAEHLALSLPVFRDPLEKTAALVSCIMQTRENVGVLDSEMPGPAEAAVAVAQYIIENVNSSTEWPLSSNLGNTGVEILTEMQNQQQSGSTTQSIDVQSPHKTSAQAPTKRPLVSLRD